MLGSLRKGDFGFVFARPETGKTTFLASEVSFMAMQAVGPIVHFNNEEQGNKVMLRYYQAALGLDWHQLRADLKGNREKFHEITKSNIRLYDHPSIHRRDVERVCEELNPSLIIFDQLDKIRGFDADRQDLVFGKIYQWARELAKTYGPVLAVSQASATGEGKRWLTMDDVDGSKTAKAAEADFIVGIGKTHAEEDEYTRYLHAIKNKLQGDEDSIPDLRHGRISVTIKPEIARYCSIGEE
jgi:replicative DNA helicase